MADLNSDERDERGMTLLELVVAMTLFAVLMTGLAATLTSGFELVRNNRNRSVAANLASQEMDAVRSATFSTLQSAVSTTAVDDVTYTVHREITWVANASSTGPCNGTTSTPQVLRVHVWVDWPNRRGIPAATADTELAPPVGAYDANTGHMAVKVIDRTAAPWDNLSVSITGPQARTLTTNSDGCAVFAFLPAGTYSVSLTKPGYVDRQGAASPTRTVGVAVGQMSSVQFDYDRSASLVLDLDGSEDDVVPATIPVTIGNTALVPSGTKSYTGTGQSRTVSALFPAADGYAVWAGGCADADPEGLDANGNALYPDAQRAARLSTTPGGSTHGAVDLASVRIHVQNTLGNDQSNLSVIAVHAADNVCAAGESYTLSATDSHGDIRIALPYGTWTLQAVGRTPAAAWPTTTLGPLDSLPRSAVTVVVA